MNSVSVNMLPVRDSANTTPIPIPISGNTNQVMFQLVGGGEDDREIVFDRRQLLRVLDLFNDNEE